MSKPETVNMANVLTPEQHELELMMSEGAAEDLRLPFAYLFVAAQRAEAASHDYRFGAEDLMTHLRDVIGDHNRDRLVIEWK